MNEINIGKFFEDVIFQEYKYYKLQFVTAKKWTKWWEISSNHSKKKRLPKLFDCRKGYFWCLPLCKSSRQWLISNIKSINGQLDLTKQLCMPSLILTSNANILICMYKHYLKYWFKKNCPRILIDLFYSQTLIRNAIVCDKVCDMLKTNGWHINATLS